ncbi:MAG: SufE family protein [Gammaproteobacteria bacterium]|jgi:cysteine desulfuration protein SufE
MSAAREAFEAVPFGERVTLEDVREGFELFDDWESRYRYVIDLGKDLPHLDPTLQTDDHLIRGCQSRVWLYHWYDADSNRLFFLVDSDALIVRGLASIVLAALNGTTPQNVEGFDMEAFFREIDLINHLSPTRGNGLRAMVGAIRKVAADVR